MNTGGASVQDMHDVISECQRRVKEEYDVELEPNGVEFKRIVFEKEDSLESSFFCLKSLN